MLIRFFLPLAIVVSALALWQPGLFTWAKPGIPALLGIIMFGMGVTLTTQDFHQVWNHKRLVAIGAFAQFTLMPILAWAISKLLQLPVEAMIGMILVGACPGGTASNVVTYLARGNVALSVSLTTVSTLLAPLLTPLWVKLLAGAVIDVPTGKMFLSVAQIVLAPVIVGLVVRQLLGDRLKPMLKAFPAVAMAVIIFIIAIVIGLNRPNILAFPALIMIAIVLHNILGLASGYACGWLFRADIADRRTLAIEVGMQNSGLAVALASQFFGSLAALPGALFSLWHNVSGVSLATYWAERTPTSKSTKETAKS
ncbi:MAG: bile acid:sodium symporter family protein [Verrucomicrobiota bacterium]